MDVGKGNVLTWRNGSISHHRTSLEGVGGSFAMTHDDQSLSLCHHGCTHTTHYLHKTPYRRKLRDDQSLSPLCPCYHGHTQDPVLEHQRDMGEQQDIPGCNQMAELYTDIGKR